MDIQSFERFRKKKKILKSLKEIQSFEWLKKKTKVSKGFKFKYLGKKWATKIQKKKKKRMEFTHSGLKKKTHCFFLLFHFGFNLFYFLVAWCNGYRVYDRKVYPPLPHPTSTSCSIPQSPPLASSLFVPLTLTLFLFLNLKPRWFPFFFKSIWDTK